MENKPIIIIIIISNQKPILEGGFSTVMSVPNTRDASLAKTLIRNEAKLAKLTKYNVKIVEKSGLQLRRLLQRVYAPIRCHCPTANTVIPKAARSAGLLMLSTRQSV